MKKLIALTLISLSTIWAGAQNPVTKEVKSKINSVVVFLDGAEISRKSSVALVKGQNKLVFKNLSPQLMSKNIQVTAGPGVSILSITTRTNYLSAEKQKPRITQLKDSLDLVKAKVAGKNDIRDAYNLEKQLLLKNQELGGETSGVVIADLVAAANFFRKRIQEINSQVTKLNVEITQLQNTEQRLNQELTSLNATNQYQRAEVTILVSTETSLTTNIELRYLVNKAGWAPSYDLKAKDLNKPVELIYRGKVYNNTSIDWTNVKLKLSTADPSLSATQPKLSPWYLNYRPNQRSNMNRNIGRLNSAPQVQGDKLRKWKSGGAVNMVFEKIEVPDLSAEFDIAKPYTILSDANLYIVDVDEFNLPCSFKHYAVPKVEKDAFLLAQVTGWEDLNLVEGYANVYFDGTFVGQSFIYTRNVSDTLEISLGRDKKVLVTRTKLKDFSSRKLIGTNRKATLGFETIVKNNRKSAIDIEVLDQLPVSQDSDIEVNAIELSNAEKNDLSGELKWNFHIEPGQFEKTRLVFSIRYPKNKPINIKRTKTKTARYF